jgi:hypothetical protein
MRFVLYMMSLQLIDQMEGLTKALPECPTARCERRSRKAGIVACVQAKHDHRADEESTTPAIVAKNAGRKRETASVARLVSAAETLVVEF